MTAAVLGRRERQKLERRATIVRCARNLFREFGYEATSVEQIAEAADVSAGTVYNFFPSKIEILMAFFSSDVEEKMAESLAALGPPPADPREGVLRLIAAQIRLVEGLSRKYVKLVVTQTLLTGRDSPAGRADAAVDALLTADLVDLINHYKRAGALPSDLDTEARAKLIFCAINGEFYLWLADDSITTDQRIATIREFLEVLVPDPRETSAKAMKTVRRAPSGAAE